jgi:uncharacterized cupin superfamily protein
MSHDLECNSPDLTPVADLGCTNPTDEPVRILAVSTKRFPDVIAYPEQGIAWVATRHTERPVAEGGDEGIIARFELPREE